MIQLTLSEIAQSLHARLEGDDCTVTGCSIDTRTLQPGDLFVAMRGEHVDAHDLLHDAITRGAAAVMVEREIPAVPASVIHVSDSLEALGSLGSLWRLKIKPQHVVAITGSNGKTTVKEMLSSIFSQAGNTLSTLANYNNELGLPLTLLQLTDMHQYVVLEMGARKVGDIDYLTNLAQPTVATVTQCAPAHLEGFKDIDGVANGKGEIFNGLGKHGVAIINNDDVYADRWREFVSRRNTGEAVQQRKIMTFAMSNIADVTAQNIQQHPDCSDFTLKTTQGEIAIHLPVSGRHNIMNALNSAACALACDCSLETIQAGLAAMQPAQGRLQHLQGIKGCHIIDDSYNANPTSMQAAVNVLAQYPAPRCLVIGDMLELGERSQAFHHQLGRWANDAGIETLLAVGEMSRYTVEAFNNGGQHFTQQDDLIEVLRDHTTTDTTVLIKGSRGMQMDQVVSAIKTTGAV